MGTTYSTSIECAYAGGVKNFGTSSRPNTNNVDQWRSIIYSKICRIIGFGTADLNDVAKNIEIEKVMLIIMNWLEDGKLTDKTLLNLTDSDESFLSGEFGAGPKLEVIFPDANVTDWN